VGAYQRINVQCFCFNTTRPVDLQLLDITTSHKVLPPVVTLIHLHLYLLLTVWILLYHFIDVCSATQITGYLAAV
jgi:hypothetical protein